VRLARLPGDRALLDATPNGDAPPARPRLDQRARALEVGARAGLAVADRRVSTTGGHGFRGGGAGAGAVQLVAAKPGSDHACGVVPVGSAQHDPRPSLTTSHTFRNNYCSARPAIDTDRRTRVLPGSWTETKDDAM
jgi:hypothetical protein